MYSHPYVPANNSPLASPRFLTCCGMLHVTDAIMFNLMLLFMGLVASIIHFLDGLGTSFQEATTVRLGVVVLFLFLVVSTSYARICKSASALLPFILVLARAKCFDKTFQLASLIFLVIFFSQLLISLPLQNPEQPIVLKASWVGTVILVGVFVFWQLSVSWRCFKYYTTLSVLKLLPEVMPSPFPPIAPPAYQRVEGAFDWRKVFG